MKLKTLKDLDFGDRMDKRIIKKEAIKWVKHLRTIDLKQRWYGHQALWIMEFFNITEEDLK